MTRFDQIEKSVATLSDAELKEFGEWFNELRWERWDRQLEADAKAGKLDRLVADAAD